MSALPTHAAVAEDSEQEIGSRATTLRPAELATGTAVMRNAATTGGANASGSGGTLSTASVSLGRAQDSFAPKSTSSDDDSSGADPGPCSSSSSGHRANDPGSDSSNARQSTAEVDRAGIQPPVLFGTGAPRTGSRVSNPPDFKSESPAPSNGRNSATRLERSTDAYTVSDANGSPAGSPGPAPVRTRNVYVAALPLDFTVADLSKLLSEFGKLKSCRMFNAGSHVNEIGRSYGFALFEDPSSAEGAVAALDGKPMGNARMQCQLSRNGVVKKPKGPRATAATATTAATAATTSTIATAPGVAVEHDSSRTNAPLSAPAPTTVSLPVLPTPPGGFTSAASTTTPPPLPSMWGMPPLGGPAMMPNPFWPGMMPMPGGFMPGFMGAMPPPPFGAMSPPGFAWPTPTQTQAAPGSAAQPVPVMTPQGMVWMRPAFTP